MEGLLPSLPLFSLKSTQFALHHEKERNFFVTKVLWEAGNFQVDGTAIYIECQIKGRKQCADNSQIFIFFPELQK